jgi:RNA polymerase sigma factor (sigma-70 family)
MHREIGKKETGKKSTRRPLCSNSSRRHMFPNKGGHDMTSGSVSKVLHQLRRAALVCDSADLSDGQLLQLFIDQRDEAAFEVLVRRHGPMVMGVCQRIAGQLQDAEDAFQATFLVLVRRASTVVPREMVGNWLYGVAYRTALEARGKSARRQAKMKQVTDMPDPKIPVEPGWQDLEPLLDRELNGLPDKYRMPLVLCQLEGRSRKEVARQLQVAEGTLSSRLATGRTMLARRLARHGVAIAAGPLALLLSQPTAVACVPGPLLSSTIKAAAGFAAGDAAALSPRVAALTQGVLRAMFMTKLKVTVLCWLAVAGVVTLGGGAWMHRSLAEAPGDRVAQPVVSVGQAPSPVTVSAATTQEQDRQDRQEGKKTVGGMLKAVDTGKNTITVLFAVSRTDPPEEKTMTVPGDCAIVQDGKKVKLGDLKTEHRVTLTLAADGKTLSGISIVGPTLSGKLLAVDVVRNTLTISMPIGRDGGTMEETLELAERHSITQDGKPAKLGDLKADNGVTVAASTDKKTAFSVTVSGRTVAAVVKSFDATKNTITVEIASREPEEKTFAVKKGLKAMDLARQEAEPTELKEGARVMLTFSAVERDTIISIRVYQPR